MIAVEPEMTAVVWASLKLAAAQQSANRNAEQHWRIVLASEAKRLTESIGALPPAERPHGWDTGGSSGMTESFVTTTSVARFVTGDNGATVDRNAYGRMPPYRTREWVADAIEAQL